MSKGKKAKKKYNDIGSMWEDFYDQIRMLHAGYTILLGIGFASSFIIWWYVFVGMKPLSSRILAIEAIITLLIFAAYLYRIFFVGYDDRLWKNFRNSWLALGILSFVGFYIAKVSFIGSPNEMTSMGLYTFMRFITNIFASVVLTMIPALIITFIIWFVVGIVEFFTKP